MRLFGIAAVWRDRRLRDNGISAAPLGCDLPYAALAVYAEVLAAHLIAARFRAALTKRIVEHLGSFITSTVKIEHELDLSGLDASGISSPEPLRTKRLRS